MSVKSPDDQLITAEEEIYAGDSDSDSEETEDDPLSEIWDSEDIDEDQIVTPPPNAGEFVQVKTVADKVDLTPPEIQLQRLETSVRYCYKKKMADECLKEAVKRLTLTRIVEGDDKPWKLASCHATIAKVYWNLKSYAAQTVEHAVEAQRLLSFPSRYYEKSEKSGILDTALLATYLHGKALLNMKKYPESSLQLEKAEKLLEERKRLGDMKDKNFWLTEISTALARIRIFQNNSSDALRHLRRVEKLMQKRYGNESHRLIPLYQEIAKVEESAGNVERAIELHMKAYSIAKHSFDDKNPHMGDAALALARAYCKIKDEESDVYIESYFNEAIACYTVSLGPTNGKTLKAVQELAEELSSTERPLEAISLLTQCLRTLSAAGEEYDIKAGKIHKQLAMLYLETGKNRQAVQLLKNCLNIETMHYGPSSQKTKTTKDALEAIAKNTKHGHDRGRSLERRPRFSAVVSNAAVEAGRRFSWEK